MLTHGVWTHVLTQSPRWLMAASTLFPRENTMVSAFFGEVYDGNLGYLASYAVPNRHGTTLTGTT